MPHFIGSEVNAGVEIKGAKALVVGMAKSGMAAVELLRKHGQGPVHEPRFVT